MCNRPDPAQITDSYRQDAVMNPVGCCPDRRKAPPGGGPVAANGSQGADVLPVALQRDAEYRKTRAQLVTEVEARLATMPQAEREKVGASLATLRRSISEIARWVMSMPIHCRLSFWAA